MREWLKKLRTDKGLSMKEMGKMLDISESYYCTIEKGERQKRMDMVLVAGLAAIFEIPITAIVEYETEWAAKNA